MSAAKNINITLKIWRQKNSKAKGNLETYKLNDVSTASSFLEMLDQLNEQLHLIMIVAKEFVECVHYTSMVALTDQILVLRLANCT